MVLYLDVMWVFQWFYIKTLWGIPMVLYLDFMDINKSIHLFAVVQECPSEDGRDAAA